MSSAQDRQANTSEARLDQLDQDMRRLLATVQELAVSVSQSRTRRINSTGQVDKVRSNRSADGDGNLDSGVAGIDTNQQGTARVNSRRFEASHEIIGSGFESLATTSFKRAEVKTEIV